MVKVVANNYVKEDCIEKYLEIAKVLVEKTNALDAGCIQYELCRNKSDPTHFVMLEAWESQEALDAHMKSAHFVELLPQMRDFSAKQGGVALFESAF